MNILLIGSGGREHALSWKIAQSEKCDTLFVAPGSDAIAEEPNTQCIAIGVEDIDALVTFAEDNKIELVVIGPEAPLVLGLANRLRDKNIPVFGPEKDGAQIEGSKGFMKDLCAEFDIPTARYKRFTNLNEAIPYIEAQNFPLVIKADGLAAGKGVIIAQNLSEATDAATEMLTGESFGAAGTSIVIEEFLEGEEVSFFAITDGQTLIALNSAQDHKRAFDNDEGPNTGGMGAFSPARKMLWDKELEQRTLDTIIAPTLKGLQARGISYCGVLYAGLMIVDTNEGKKPYLIEYNARFGDPECQALMMRLRSDIVDLLYAAATSQLSEWSGKVRWHDKTALNIVYAAQGYPGSYQKGTPILNLEQLPEEDGFKVFHAGTKRSEVGTWEAHGGRVLGVTAMADTPAEARTRAYTALKNIEWDAGFYRTDICKNIA